MPRNPFTAVRNKANGLRQAAFDYSLDAIETKLASLLNAAIAKDPWRPSFLSNPARKLAHELLSGLFNGARIAEDVALKETRKIASQVDSWPSPPNLRTRPFSWLRAKLLYTLMAGDKSFWWTARQPLFWLFVASTLFPFGVCLLSFTMLFFAIDWSDEYQMANYICSVKTTYAIQRLGLMMVGIVQLYLSSTSSTCESTGPGLADHEQLAVLTLIPQQLLVAVAFVQYSRLRALRRLIWKRKEAAKTQRGRGLRIRESVLAPAARSDRNERGVLIVRVLCANDLVAADHRGTSDPYASVKLGSSKRRTSTIMRTLSPKWNEGLGFEGTLGEMVAAGPLVVKLFDADVISKDDFLGETDVRLDRLFDTTVLAINDAPLRGVASGRVSLELTWKCFSDAATDSIQPQLASAPPPWEADVAQSASSFLVALDAIGELELLVTSARDLVPKDSGGTSDPYVQAKFAGIKLKTSTKTKTLVPEWNQVLSFKGVRGAQLDTEPLELKLYDRDTFSSDDFLGVIQVRLEALRTQRAITMVDARLAGARSGAISFTVAWLPGSAIQEAPPGCSSAERRASASRAPNTSLLSESARLRKLSIAGGVPHSLLDLARWGELEVHISRAHDLVAKDEDGLSDPFVVACLGHAKQRTPTIKNTLDPRWEETLCFEGLLGELVEKGPLLLTVWDYDAFSPNDFLGSLEAPLGPLLEKSSFEINCEPLDGVERGAITLDVTWFPHTLEHDEKALPWCGGRPSTVQKSMVRKDRPFRIVMIWDAVVSVSLLCLASADLLLRIRQHKWHAAISDLLPMWWQIYSLSTSALERKSLWFFSTFGVFLLSLPFVPFKLPGLSGPLLRLEQSGYDQSGQLRVVLTAAQKFMKYEEEQRLLSKDQTAVKSEKATRSQRRSLV